MAQPSFSPVYDNALRRTVKRYWYDVRDWRLLKAQCYQESRLDPLAVSPVGAAGLCQFMRGTWSDVSGRLGWQNVNRFDPSASITAAAWYMQHLRDGWSSPRPVMDRHFLALSSYNAGFGNLLKAQKLCGGPALYADIVACLPMVTGHHSEETITYVERIRQWREMMQ